MNWINTLIFFPIRFFGEIDGVWRFKDESLAEFFARYLVDTTAAPQTIDGIPVTLSPVERETLLATIAPDDCPLTRFRKASLEDGTLDLRPVFDPPLADDSNPGEVVPTGFVIACCWSATFLADLARDPQPEPGLFDGIHIIT